MCLNGECRKKKFFVLQGETEKEMPGMEPGEELHLCCYRVWRWTDKTNSGLMLHLASSTMTFFMKHKCPIKTTVQSQL